jgi:SAM-dependent methyltransferase
MNRSSEGGFDPSNITYTTLEEGLYDSSGNIYPFVKEKYQPIVDVILQYYQGKKTHSLLNLLDVGIGYGAFLKFCEDNDFKSLYGMDPFPNSIAIAKKYTSANIKEGSIEDLPWPFEEGFFDIITCIDVVEHLDEPELFFKNVNRYINDNGVIVLRTPNNELAYKLRRLPLIGVRDNNPTHVNVKNPRYWRGLAKKYRFDILKEWKGEHLTHIKHISHLSNYLSYRKIDHRYIPFLNMFEQAYIMFIKKRE